ncbi:uncharacterized protein [Acropora muricata]|uniref:uncharacterized protein n=1 Tax=Acropora muricata TaxID=159855 RepID=UPI0034E3C9A3
MLRDWLKPVVQINGQWILCWRASLHGWAASSFHSLCDNKGPTVTIVKDTNNNIFGGYTSISWESSRQCKSDSKAFLFSLKNPTNDPRKLPQIHNRIDCVVVQRPIRGPSFAGLNIPRHANRNGSCNEYLGYAYIVPSGKPGDRFLTGDNSFTASEVETFYEAIQ